MGFSVACLMSPDLHLQAWSHCILRKKVQMLSFHKIHFCTLFTLKGYILVPKWCILVPKWYLWKGTAQVISFVPFSLRVCVPSFLSPAGRLPRKTQHLRSPPYALTAESLGSGYYGKSRRVIWGRKDPRSVEVHLWQSDLTVLRVGSPATFGSISISRVRCDPNETPALAP